MSATSSSTSDLAAFVHQLRAAYGPQGWWPLLGHDGTNPTKTGSVTGYHPGDYLFPRNQSERFEIGCGAILTQNCAWPNVEKALRRLQIAGLLAPDALLATSDSALQDAIRPAGFFRGKSRKLREFARFFSDLGDSVPTRAALLALWGVGPETADSMRLYAWNQPELVVDAYSNRVLLAAGFIDQPLPYERLKAFCAARLPSDVPFLQEFHALIVEHAKRRAKKPDRS